MALGHGINHQPGDYVRLFLEHWVSVGPGHEKNVSKPFEGLVTEVWHKPHPREPERCSGRNYMRLYDGRVVFRADCYDPRSPYDWQLLSAHEQYY